MTETRQITCDGCGKDLTNPTPRPGYYLQLSEVPLPTGAIVYSIPVYSMLDGDKHFCDGKCFDAWQRGAADEGLAT